jgi:hypothetical protein
LLKHANLLRGQFATIGQVGRIYKDGTTYIVRDAPRAPSACRPVDLTCRAHFLHREDVQLALYLRDRLLQKGHRPKPGSEDDWTRHDDILLCHGIQANVGYPSYILPALADPEELIIKENLPDPNAMHRRAGHLESRQHLIDISKYANWRSRIRQDEKVTNGQTPSTSTGL